MLLYMSISTLVLSSLLLYLCIKKDKPKVIAISGIAMSLLLMLQGLNI